MEAIKYGIQKDREKAIYPTNTCLFTYGRDLSSCVIRIVWEN